VRPAATAEIRVEEEGRKKQRKIEREKLEEYGK